MFENPSCSKIYQITQPISIHSSLPYEEGPIPLSASTSHNWIFPTDDKYPERSYQLQMARASLMANTLVCLPTGLGKTLIAAVVMYNYYRWFPEGKVVCECIMCFGWLGTTTTLSLSLS